MSTLFSKSDQTPLVDISPNSVPSPIFLRYLNETTEHTLYQDVDLEASSTLKQIQTLESLIPKLNECISHLYSYRSIMKPFKNHFTITPENQEKVEKLIISESQPIIKFITDISSLTKGANSIILSYLTSKQIWTEGAYSSALFLSLCCVLSRLLIIDQLHFVKKSFIFDLFFINDLLNNNNKKSMPFLDSSAVEWVRGRTFNEAQIYAELEKSPIFTDECVEIIIRWIQKKYTSHTYLSPELNINVLHSLAFFIKHFRKLFQQIVFNFFIN